MIYELINLSDAMTIETDDDRVAQAAVLFLGEGKMGVRSEDGRTVLPLLLFGGDKWIAENFKDPAFDDFVTQNYGAIAAALESLIYGAVADRRAIIAAMGEAAAPEAFKRWNDEKRTSLSDWSKYAFSLAERFRQKAEAQAG